MTKRKGISKRLRFRIMKRDSFMCRYCGDRGDGVELVIDHITPVARGGTNDPDNLVTACWDCNSGKTDEPLDVQPPWTPLPPKTGFKPQSRGHVFRLGQTPRDAERHVDMDLETAKAAVLAEIERSTSEVDEDGNYHGEGSDYVDLTIWRPANNPHSSNAYEPHLTYIYDARNYDDPLTIISADAYERKARELFDALPHHEGWVYWRGGSSPLPAHINSVGDCEYLFRSGHKDTAPMHMDNPWMHIAQAGWDGWGDIIAYRIRKQTPRQPKWRPKKSGVFSFDEVMQEESFL